MGVPRSGSGLTGSGRRWCSDGLLAHIAELGAGFGDAEFELFDVGEVAGIVWNVLVHLEDGGEAEDALAFGL